MNLVHFYILAFGLWLASFFLFSIMIWLSWNYAVIQIFSGLPEVSFFHAALIKLGLVAIMGKGFVVQNSD
jgi:hypothetical protein